MALEKIKPDNVIENDWASKFWSARESREASLSLDNMSRNLNVVKYTMGRPVGGMLQEEVIASLKIQNGNDFSLEG